MDMADRALYLAKPEGRTAVGAQSPADPYLRALDETALALLDRHDSTVLLETILTHATALLGTAARLHLPRPSPTRRPSSSATAAACSRTSSVDRMAIDEGLDGQVFRTGAPLAVADYDSFPGRSPAMPVGALRVDDGRAAGCRAARRSASSGSRPATTDRAFGPRETHALVRFAQLASIALDNSRLFDAAQRGALHDPTTGLPNRELLTGRIADALAATPADGAGVAVILLDLDRFKVINESVGHAVGDRLLAAVGQRLVGSLRPSDTVARFGGDEFGIVLDPVQDADDARRIAERIGNDLRASVPDGRSRMVHQRVARDRRSAGPAGRPPGSSSGRRRSRWSGPRAIRHGDTPCSSRRCPIRRWTASTWRTTCGAPSSAASCGSTTSRSSTSPATGSSGSRRSSAGSTPSAGSSRRWPSSRWPRRPV